MAGEFIAASPEKLIHAAGVGRIDATGEQPPRLHHLMPRIMHCCGGVITGPDQRELIRYFRV